MYNSRNTHTHTQPFPPPRTDLGPDAYLEQLLRARELGLLLPEKVQRLGSLMKAGARQLKRHGLTRAASLAMLKGEEGAL